MVCDEAVQVLNEVQEEGIASDAFLEKYLTHRRGDFVSVPVGVSFGGGQKVRLYRLLRCFNKSSWHEQLPGNLVHSKPRQRLIQKLMSHKSIKRIAGFQSSRSKCIPEYSVLHYNNVLY